MSSTQTPTVCPDHEPDFSGAAFRRLRERAGMSRLDVAKAIGVRHVAIIEAWEDFDDGSSEHGDLEPAGSDLLRLARVLKCDVLALTEVPERATMDVRMARYAEERAEDVAAETSLSVHVDGPTIASLRAARGLTEDEVARRARVHGYVVDALEESRADEINLDEILRVLSVLSEDPVATLAKLTTARQVGHAAHKTENRASSYALHGRDEGKAIRAARVAADLDVHDVVRRAGISQEQVRSIEEGHSWNAEAAVFCNYARAIGLPIDRAAELAHLVKPRPKPTVPKTKTKKARTAKKPGGRRASKGRAA